MKTLKKVIGIVAIMSLLPLGLLILGLTNNLKPGITPLQGMINGYLFELGLFIVLYVFFIGLDLINKD